MNVVYFEAEKYYRIAFDYFQYESNLSLAQKYVNLALKNNGQHFKSLMLKGEIFLAKKKIQEALKMFSKAEQLNPGNLLCSFNSAKAYDLADNSKEALKLLDKILKSKNQNNDFLTECYKLKINILMKLNQYKKAEKILKMLNKKLSSNDIYDLEENFYKTIENNRYFNESSNNRILHINF